MRPLHLIAAVLAVATATAELTEVEIDAFGDAITNDSPKSEVRFNIDFEERFLQTNSEKSTKAPSTKSTKAPSTKSTKAPSTKSTKAPSTKSTKAPSTKSTKAPSPKSTKAPTSDDESTREPTGSRRSLLIQQLVEDFE